MKSSKKGIMIDSFARIIIMVLLVFVAFAFGKKIVGAFVGSDAPQHLDTFAGELSSLKNHESKEAFITLDSGMAVIGFSSGSDEFRCYGCFQGRDTFSDKLLYYSMKKPPGSECSGKSCVCLCLDEFSAAEIDRGESRPLYCKKFYCQAMEQDIAMEIYLEGSIRQKGITMANYPYWENGFMFVRTNNADTPSNGMTPANNEGKQTVCIAKRNLEGKFYVGAYPAPCLGQPE
jgi:hypothetical protein